MKETIFMDINGKQLDEKELHEKRAELNQMIESREQKRLEELVHEIVNYINSKKQ